MTHPYHTLLPRAAQDALMNAAQVGTPGSAERNDAVKVATAYAVSKAPDAFKCLRDREG